MLQAQLQTQSLGKGNFNVGKDETESVPPVSTHSSINPLAQSPQPDNILMASGGKCCRNAQPTETFNRFSPLKLLDNIPLKRQSAKLKNIFSKYVTFIHSQVQYTKLKLNFLLICPSCLISKRL